MLARALIAVALAAGVASAESSFQVNPTLITLSKAAPAEAVVISNHGTEPLRVQLSASTWTEDRDGKMQLAPSSDIIVRPSLLQVEPGRSKTVRVGAAVTATTVEKSYRLFVEQLPDRRTTEGGKVVVLTRIGVPVFVAPETSKELLDANLVVSGKVATVSVRDRGTRHVKLASIAVRALAGDSPRWERRVVGWYVLPGATRDFAVELGDEQCKPGEVLVAELVSDTGAVWSTSPQRCD